MEINNISSSNIHTPLGERNCLRSSTFPPYLIPQAGTSHTGGVTVGVPAGDQSTIPSHPYYASLGAGETWPSSAGVTSRRSDFGALDSFLWVFSINIPSPILIIFWANSRGLLGSGRNDQDLTQTQQAFSLPSSNGRISRLYHSFHGGEGSALHPAASRAPRHPPTQASAESTDPRPPRAFQDLAGYKGLRNSDERLNCFHDCKRQRVGGKGFGRRGNLYAHLRQYHGQKVPRRGGQPARGQ